ncbi:MAG: penicillin-binding transpeptidase domain-containing protein [Acidobacteriota bacterium]
MSRRIFNRRRFLAGSAALLLSPASQTAGRTTQASSAEAIFKAAGVTGAFCLQELATGEQTVVFPRHVDLPFRPASTFKIPNTLIGLATGVIPNAELELPWDGRRRPFVEAWNRDHDLESAMKNSVLWYFEEIARRVGLAAYREYLTRFDYGNRDPSGHPTSFWLAGNLRISVRQQASFLARLLNGALDVPQRHLEVVRQILPSAVQRGTTVRAKTGLCEQGDRRVGWQVGWIERHRPTHSFAAVVLGDTAGAWRESPTFAARRQVAPQLLHHFGQLPAELPALR